MSDEQKSFVVSAMIEVVCEADDVIISQGEDGDHFYLVDEGQHRRQGAKSRYAARRPAAPLDAPPLSTPLPSTAALVFLGVGLHAWVPLRAEPEGAGAPLRHSTAARQCGPAGWPGRVAR